MAIKGEVHWHEGMFLQPHHLQTMQRMFMDRLGAERHLIQSYPYGVVESEHSLDALDNQMVQFDRLEAVMRSGVALRYPENTDLPALDIKEAMQASQGSITVYLGLPLWHSERANVVASEKGEDWRVKRIFNIAEMERMDENTGENVQPMPVKRYNARLLLEGDDLSDMEVIPIMKIRQGTGEDVGRPRLDRDFIPPCFVLRGSPVLANWIRDLSNQVEASRKELTLQIGGGEFRVENMRGVQFEQMFRLRTLNRFSARLGQLVHAPAISPFAVYLELCALLGELAALYPEQNQFEADYYNHDDPAHVFSDILQKIRGLLRGAVKASYSVLPFEHVAQRLEVILTDEHFEDTHEFYLGIRSSQGSKEIAKLVEDPDKFKMMAKSLIERAIWGVKLALEHTQPLELPAEADLIFFKLVREESMKMWDRIRDEKRIALVWPGMDTSDFKCALYMTETKFEVR